MTNQQTKEQEKLEEAHKLLDEWRELLSKVKLSTIKLNAQCDILRAQDQSFIEKAAQATIENAKSYNAAEAYVKARCIRVDAQDQNKIYWKG